MSAQFSKGMDSQNLVKSLGIVIGLVLGSAFSIANNNGVFLFVMIHYLAKLHE